MLHKETLRKQKVIASWFTKRRVDIKNSVDSLEEEIEKKIPRKYAKKTRKWKIRE